MNDNLRQLLQYLDELKNPASLEELKGILLQATLKAADIREYFIFSDGAYSRNCIKKTDLYEALVLCWKSGQRSAIHDHYTSNCAFQVIQGVCTEIYCEPLQRWSEGKQIVRAVQTRNFTAGQICGSLADDIHEISNLDSRGESLITLHLYSPPLQMRTYLCESSHGVSEYASNEFIGLRD